MSAQLIIPEHFVLDDVARDQMERSLARAPKHLAGIVACTGQLPPGSSYRVHAEWRSLDFPSDVDDSHTIPVRSAALLRPGVPFEWRGDTLAVDGPLLVDRGAHAHDARSSAGPLDVASARGRSPFPRRPIVVFVACRPDPELGDWARGLVNELVPRDVEGRLALTEVPPGSHLTRPCLPCPESIRALGPDIVVALDAGAAAEVPAWCGTDRKTVIVELAPDPHARTELVSWRVGKASGRLRARIGRGIDAPELVRLVARLCAGPQPMPPRDEGARAVATSGDRAHTGEGRRPASPSVVVVSGTTEGQLSTRGQALIEQLSAAAVTVSAKALESAVVEKLMAADLVLLTATAREENLDAVIARRGADGRPTVLDVVAADLVPDVPAPGLPHLVPRAATLAAKCGLVTTPEGAVRDAARAVGVRTHVLPTLPSRTRARALEDAYRERPSGPAAPLIVGWHIGSQQVSKPSYFDAVASALGSLLEQRPSLRVHLVGEPSAVPAPLKGHERVTTTVGAVDAGTLASWSVHAWTPALFNGALADDAFDAFDASYAAVPSLMPVPGRAGIDGFVAPELLVRDYETPNAWAAAFQRLIDDDAKRSMLSRQEAQRSHAVYGPVAAQAVVQRFLGWTFYRAAG